MTKWKFTGSNQIVTPNGVTHTTTGESDFVEFLIEPEWVHIHQEQGWELEPYMEEWEIAEYDQIEDKDYTLGLRVFDVPNLRSVVDPTKDMPLRDIMKCFKVELLGVKAITRFLDACETEVEYYDFED